MYLLDRLDESKIPRTRKKVFSVKSCPLLRTLRPRLRSPLPRSPHLRRPLLRRRLLNQQRRTRTHQPVHHQHLLHRSRSRQGRRGDRLRLRLRHCQRRRSRRGHQGGLRRRQRRHRGARGAWRAQSGAPQPGSLARLLRVGTADVSYGRRSRCARTGPREAQVPTRQRGHQGAHLAVRVREATIGRGWCPVRANVLGSDSTRTSAR